MSCERNLITDDANLAVLHIAMLRIDGDPCVRNMRQNFSLEVCVDIFFERYIFVVTQVGVVEFEAAGVDRVIQREVQIMVKIRAGGDDPVHEPGLDERDDA